MVGKPARLNAAAAVALGILTMIHAAGAQEGALRERVPAKREAARRAFEDDRFGLFIHWGVYSLVGEGAWVMEHDKLPIHEYAKLPPLFSAKSFDAEAWVKLAKTAGAKYITVAAKHHDGFCMFDSRLTDYDIVDSSAYHGDPLKALADACRSEKIKLIFFYSLLDWHHPDYFPLGKTGAAAGREKRGDWKRYVAYYQGQVRELCTSYGEIGGIWFDGWWDRPDAMWDLSGTYQMIHELQPGALVANNHHGAPLPGEDFQILDRETEAPNAAGFPAARASAELPLEVGITITTREIRNSRAKQRSSGRSCRRPEKGQTSS
jgi:alpha-L-fucosidase